MTSPEKSSHPFTHKSCRGDTVLLPRLAGLGQELLLPQKGARLIPVSSLQHWVLSWGLAAGAKPEQG